jgi:hypothetical protein
MTPDSILYIAVIVTAAPHALAWGLSGVCYRGGSWSL